MSQASPGPIAIKHTDAINSFLKNSFWFLPCTFDSNIAPFVEKGLISTMLDANEMDEMTPMDDIVGSWRIGMASGIMAAKKPVVEAKDEIIPPT